MDLRRYLPLLIVAAVLTGCDAATPRSEQVSAKTPEAKLTEVASTLADDVAAAQRRAEAEQKPLVLFFTAEWCSFCRQMRSDVFDRSEFAAAAQRFIVVEVDGAKHPELCAKYRVAAYPTLLLAAPDGTPLDRIVGLSDAQTIVAKMNAALTTFIALRPEAATTR